ncbi:MAG: phage Gp37/Gp68 family protein [Polyangiales bacterium]
MGVGSSIEWTEATWNPLTGCDKISPGCKHCYAERMAARLKAMGQPNYAKGFELTLHESMLKVPLGWRQPRTIFVNSMSDLFHKKVPEDFVRRVFDVIVRADWHQFQMLTKRADRLAMLAPTLPWPDHLWMGVSVESEKYISRIDHLRRVPARVRFLSLEPLLGPLPALDLTGIHWVIVGGESGPGAREMKRAWVRDLRDQCIAARVPFFFKQWGGVNKKKTGRTLDDRTWDQLPPRTSAAKPRSLPLFNPASPAQITAPQGGPAP